MSVTWTCAYCKTIIGDDTFDVRNHAVMCAAWPTSIPGEYATPEQMFLSLITECDGIEMADRTVYVKDRHVVAELDISKNTRMLWVSGRKIWRPLKDRFGLTDDQVRDLILGLMDINLVAYLPL